MKSLTTIVIGILGAFTVTGCALAGDDEKAGQLQQDLVGGTIDTGHPFAVGVCAGGLVAADQPNPGTCAAIRCSGTLVAPNRVLTARHCVQLHIDAPVFCDGTYTNDPFSTSPVLVTTSPSVASGPPVWHEVERVEVPATNHLCDDDVAILVLKDKIPRREAWPVKVDFRRDLAKRPPHEVAIVGRGRIVSNYFTGETDTGGFLRRTQTHIPFLCATNDAAHPCEVPDFSLPPSNVFVGALNHFMIGAAVLPGDSGAGVFDQATFHRRAPRLIGVVAGYTVAEDGNPNFGFMSRVDRHADFFRATLRHGGDDDDDRDDDHDD